MVKRLVVAQEIAVRLRACTPHSVLKRIVDLLERLCCLAHPFHELEIKLFGNHCQLALLSAHLDEKWETGVWQHFAPGEYSEEDKLMT